MNRGVYVVWLYLPRMMTINVGKLGVFDFDAGVYAYCGSAQRNLRQRIARHQRREKNMHWHIDYLRLKADYLGEVILPGSPKEMECALVSELLRIPAAGYGVIGFGSSDCRCPSHLIYVPTARPKQA